MNVCNTIPQYISPPNLMWKCDMPLPRTTPSVGNAALPRPPDAKAPTPQNPIGTWVLHCVVAARSENGILGNETCAVFHE